MLDRGKHARRRLQRLIAPCLPNLSHRKQHAIKSRPPITVVARKICSPKIRSPIRSQKRRQRPTALPADRRHRRLIPAVHIRPLIAIHFNRDEMLIHNLRQRRVLVALAIHHMAPVTPHRANIQQNWFVLARRARKRLCAPLMPVDRLMHSRTKIRRSRPIQRIPRLFHHLRV